VAQYFSMNDKPKKYYTIKMRVSLSQYRIFSQAKELGITQKMIIQTMCQQSCNTNVIVFNKKKSKSISLPTGFMCKK